MKFRTSTSGRQLGFQIAPMIDVVFLLLCFFIASQIFSQWETEIDIKLPTASSGRVPRRLEGEIILNIRQDGNVVVNGRILDDASLRSLLGRLVELWPGQPVLLRGDSRTSYGHVVHVLDLCRQSDIWNVSFATSAEEEGGPPPVASSP